MTQAQLECAVAVATGESVRTVHRLGFGLVGPRPLNPGAEGLRLLVDCHRCGSAAPMPGRRHPDRIVFAECPGCGVAFDFRDEEVYAATPGIRRGHA